MIIYFLPVYRWSFTDGMLIPILQMKARNPPSKETCQNEYPLSYSILLALSVLVAEVTSAMDVGVRGTSSYVSSVLTTLLRQISFLKSVPSHLEQNLVKEGKWPNLKMPFPFQKKVLADTNQRQSQGGIPNTLWAMIMSMEWVYRLWRRE